MATHDYNIANQGFPAFRTDLNDALAAIVSNNSNATAPATTFAHMIWVDTSANPSVLKIRNADNDAWITIGSLNQTDDKFKLTPADGVSTDTISELTSAAGVTIDGVLLKDSEVTTDVINEKTSATGVTIDGVLLKDSQVTTDQINEKTSAAGVTIDSVLLKDGTVKATTTIGVGNATPSTSGAGITFPATQSASSDANTLDDYEEGTWTPTLSYASGTSGVAYGTQDGNYVKVGRAVHVQLVIQATTKGTGSGELRISLPFQNSGSRGALAVGNTQNITLNNSSKELLVEGNQSFFIIRYPTNNGLTADYQIGDIADGFYVVAAGTYFI
jgi:hypothetical protein